MSESVSKSGFPIWAPQEKHSRGGGRGGGSPPTEWYGRAMAPAQQPIKQTLVHGHKAMGVFMPTE